MKKISIAPILFVIYLVVLIIGAFGPHDRAVWWVESATVWIVLIPIVVMYVKGIRFSNTAYILMSVFILMHTVGAHYTFERVPFEWFNNLFGFERNMYDRVAHFSVGFYALPIYEFVRTRGLIAGRKTAALFALFTIISVAAVYELFEWQYAVMADPEAGIAVLGSQGDIWDAQKDMLADTLGAVVALIIAWIKNLRPSVRRDEVIQ
ncbi:MAG: hypothetical protein RJB39_601 [Candidatus Parcubacteria bacterium]